MVQPTKQIQGYPFIKISVDLFTHSDGLPQTYKIEALQTPRKPSNIPGDVTSSHTPEKKFDVALGSPQVFF